MPVSFINPIQLLQLEHYEITAIDALVLANAKATLLSQIKDTGQRLYLGEPISDKEYQLALSELLEPEKIPYYHQIAQNAPLSAFLHHGDVSFFQSFKWDSMYRNAIYLDIISPYFAAQYSPLLLKAYLAADETLFNTLVSIAPLVLDKDKTAAYAALQQNVEETLSTIRSIRVTAHEPDNGNDLSGIKGLFKKYLPVDRIKLFPPALDFLRGQIEKEVHALSTGTSEETLLQICIPFLAKLRKGKPAENEVIRSESDMRALIRYQELQKEFHVLVLRTDNRSLTVKEMADWVKKNIDITVYNELPPAFHILHNPLALELEALAVALHQRTGNPAAGMDYLEMAEKLGYLTETTLKKLADTSADLQEYIDDPEKERPETIAEGEKKPISIWRVIFLCFVLARLGYFVYRINTPDPHPRPIASFKGNPWHETTQSSSALSESFQTIDTNQPLTGDSPLDKYLGKGEYGGTGSLTVVNNRTLDILVCLYDKQTRKMIRNVYVREQSNFTIDQLKSGSYTAEIYMGKDWNERAQNELGGTGAFTSSMIHKRIKNPVQVKENQAAPKLEINNPK